MAAIQLLNHCVAFASRCGDISNKEHAELLILNHCVAFASRCGSNRPPCMLDETPRLATERQGAQPHPRESFPCTRESANTRLRGHYRRSGGTSRSRKRLPTPCPVTSSISSLPPRQRQKPFLFFLALGSQASGLTKKEMPLGAFSSAQMHFGIIGPNL